MSAEPIGPFELNSTPATAADESWRERLGARLYRPARDAGLTVDPRVYAENYERFFRELDALDIELGERRYLCGGAEPGAADQWLALMLTLYDSVFYGLYKLNRQRLEEFSNLAHYMRDVLGDATYRNAADLESLKRHYVLESDLVNPKGRVPLGSIDLESPHDRSIRFTTGGRDSGVEEDQHKRRPDGEWVRSASRHRNRISADGSSGYRAERGRYHLYIANNCPWCHRAALTRSMKGLDDVISMDVLYYRRDPDHGWQFCPEAPGCDPDSLFGYRYIRELYDRVGSSEKSVPVLWDRETQTIVSNESAEIIRMFDDAFVEFTDGAPVLYPPHLGPQIDGINSFIYHGINNGAYKAGFADSQGAYESAYRVFFDALDMVDHMLRGRRFLLGDTVTEADVRLFPTIFRFDAVYYTRFDLNERMVRDIPSLKHWLDDMLTLPGVAEASDLDHCRKGYFGRTGNNIVPLGPRHRP